MTNHTVIFVKPYSNQIIILLHDIYLYVCQTIQPYVLPIIQFYVCRLMPKVAQYSYTMQWSVCYSEMDINMCNRSIQTVTCTRGGGVLPYLGMVERFRGDDPPFLRFSIRLGLYFIPQRNPNDSFFSAETIGLSLSHLVPEILGPKVAVIFHQNVLFNRF